MAGYKKCPRCELNYIRDDQDMCDVCKAELRLGGIELLEDEEETEELITCPICKENLISNSEKMCEECAEKFKNGEIEIESEDLENNWDDSDDVDVIEDDNELSLNELVDDELKEDEIEEDE